MTDSCLFYELPEHQKAKKVIQILNANLNVQLISQEYSIKSFYDTFDWRLYQAGLICEFTHSRSQAKLLVTDRTKQSIIAHLNINAVPQFGAQFPEGRVKNILAPIIDMRALSPLCQLPLEIYRFNVLNKSQKTILRLQLDDYEFLPTHLHLLPLKGYDKAVHKVSDVLTPLLEMQPASKTTFHSALKQQGRKPNDYSSKLNLALTADMPANQAMVIILKTLLKAIKVNESGTIADTDTEFLHDFRVAIRRTRSALAQIKPVLPDAIVAEYSEYFSWLGNITSPVRDLDVYLLNYPQYVQALPITLRDHLSPFYIFLKQRQTTAQKTLAKHLQSPNYQKPLQHWEAFLNHAKPDPDEAISNNLPIKVLADQRIWKVYHRLLKEGRAIHDQSPPTALHDLRKTTKKFRYLIEFFQCLYDDKKIKRLLKALKSFQAVLGDFQDYDVQENQIKQFSEEMMAMNTPAETLLAMGVLIQHLDRMKLNARDRFADEFCQFTGSEYQTLCKELFAEQKTGKKS